MTPELLLPSRHLIALESAARHPTRSGDGDGRVVHPAAGRASPRAREREVLELLADGATDGQIAARLAVSPATVQTHVRNAKAKLGARTRAQAVALALQRGLIGASRYDSKLGEQLRNGHEFAARDRRACRRARGPRVERIELERDADLVLRQAQRWCSRSSSAIR